MGFVGGDTHLMSAGGKALGTTAGAVASSSAPAENATTHAGAAAGEGSLTNALDGCGAAWGTLLQILATQTEALGKAADVFADDVSSATGE